jgi:hypothetical protein
VPEVGLERPPAANTRLSRKHAESDPILHQYDPIRSPKYAQCTHPEDGEFRALRPHSPSRGIGRSEIRLHLSGEFALDFSADRRQSFRQQEGASVRS